MSRKLNSSLKMEFESKKIIKLFLILLEWLTFGGLMIGVGFFVQEVWRDYQSHVTTIKQYSERFDATDPPTITFCFNPPIKTQVLEKYNLTIPQLLSHDEKEKDSYILEEGFYKIGRDFNVTNRNNVPQHLGDNDNMRLEVGVLTSHCRLKHGSSMLEKTAAQKWLGSKTARKFLARKLLGSKTARKSLARKWLGSKTARNLHKYKK